MIVTTQGDATRMWWVEARDPAKHLAVHRSRLPDTTKNDLAQDVNGVEAEPGSVWFLGLG